MTAEIGELKLKIRYTTVLDEALGDDILFVFIDKERMPYQEYMALFCDYDVYKGIEYYLVARTNGLPEYMENNEINVYEFYSNKWLDGELYYMKRNKDKLVSKDKENIGGVFPDKGVKVKIGSEE